MTSKNNGEETHVDNLENSSSNQQQQPFLYYDDESARLISNNDDHSVDDYQVAAPRNFDNNRMNVGREVEVFFNWFFVGPSLNVYTIFIYVDNYSKYLAMYFRAFIPELSA